MFRNKMRVINILLLFLFGTLSGCFSDKENFQATFEKDKKTIEKYIAENQLFNVKEIRDPSSGIVIIWETLSSSLVYPDFGDTVYVDYVGKLTDNTVFDTSIEAVAQENGILDPDRVYEPLEFIIGRNQVISGFEFAVSSMELWDKATIFIPSLFGYGSDELPGVPANSVLIFEVELLDLNKGAEGEEN